MAYLEPFLNKKGAVAGYNLMRLSPTEADLLLVLITRYLAQPFIDRPATRMKRQELERMAFVLRTIHHRSLLEKELYILQPDNDICEKENTD